MSGHHRDVLDSNGAQLWDAAQQGRTNELQAALRRILHSKVGMASIAAALRVASCNDHTAVVLALLDAAGGMPTTGVGEKSFVHE